VPPVAKPSNLLNLGFGTRKFQIKTNIEINDEFHYDEMAEVAEFNLRSTFKNRNSTEEENSSSDEFEAAFESKVAINADITELP